MAAYEKAVEATSKYKHQAAFDEVNSVISEMVEWFSINNILLNERKTKFVKFALSNSKLIDTNVMVNNEPNNRLAVQPTNDLCKNHILGYEKCSVERAMRILKNSSTGSTTAGLRRGSAGARIVLCTTIINPNKNTLQNATATRHANVYGPAQTRSTAKYRSARTIVRLPHIAVADWESCARDFNPKKDTNPKQRR
ncbi:hypothetical protein EVAR_62491_1 [Eumeta japonica]|uniref:Uncharacterized protein n=1 Tax=Eumeta variegata TaxID=151549 RepID=A0A4C1ZLN5_EUMVA|nr:hypothetical protein EVAR_62491_1 [Eumeta japonica]